jgi:hypothetical protein
LHLSAWIFRARCTSNAWIFRDCGIAPIAPSGKSTRPKKRNPKKCRFLNCGKVQWTAWRRSEIRKRERGEKRRHAPLLSSTCLPHTAALLQSPPNRSKDHHQSRDAGLSKTTAPLRTTRPYRPRLREIALLPATHRTSCNANPAVIPLGARELGELLIFSVRGAFTRSFNLTARDDALRFRKARHYWSTHV